MHQLLGSCDSLLAVLRRALFALAMALLVLLEPTSLRVAFAEQATQQVPERTGTTDHGGTADLADNPKAPHDAPRLGPGRLSATPVREGFNTFDGGWIRFHYHPSSREHVESLIAESTAIRRELSDRLGVPVLGRVRVDVARTTGEMATLAPSGAPYPDYAAGVAYPEIGLVLLTLSPVHPNSPHDLVQVFRHELAHIALFDAVSGAHVPRWFNEGFAVLVSGETSIARLQSLWTATVADTLIPLERLDAGFPSDEKDAEVAYAEAVDVVRYLVRQREHFRFQGLVERLRAGEDLGAALRGAYGIDIVELEQEWREDVAKRYTFWPVLLSGSLVWFGIMGLFLAGWRKRKLRTRATLRRWEEEEAREEVLSRINVEGSRAEGQRVHIVLARSTPQPLPLPMPMPPPEAEVPKVQHEGQWHTLH